MSYRHTPVMPTEVLQYLGCQPGKTYVDCTLGGSGHARLILDNVMPGGVLIGIDQDQDAIRHGEVVLASFAPHVHLVHANFIDLREILMQLDITAVDGILLDLGISQDQLESSGRGFSFKRDEPLDMRMNGGTGTTAEDLVNRMTERDLKRIFAEYGEERWAGRIARRIVEERKRERIQSSLSLARIISRAIPKGNATHRRIHPATRAFMALRIAVNQELENLRIFLESAVNLLSPKGRLCVLSFHSLEDRIV
ncbi:MAG: 16S rRNA (cytosine(1402)-N(4))-methyltransferase RsmH, partial [Desulfobacterales bacterium]